MSDILSSLYAQGVKATGITADSRKVAQGSLFLAYPGALLDGRRFIGEAVAQGASAVVWESEGFAWDARWQVPNLAVHDLRANRGMVADSFYGHPSQKLWMVGVTGTNGKTSCTHWLAQAMGLLGRRTALVGTLGNGFPGALSHAINTTPDPILLHGMLADYLQQGAQAITMEVSSHGLEQGRVNGVHFDVAVLTNLSRDHLDYHGDMASYAAEKRKLFDWDGLACSILNLDDELGRQIADEFAAKDKSFVTYGFSPDAMVRASGLTFTEHGLSMEVSTPQGDAVVSASVLGRFNASNLLAVLATLLASDVGIDDAVRAIGQVRPVAGRMQQLGGGRHPLIVIDYAHTPDALEKVLATLREQCHGKLVCVFGCGGNRDQGKRPLMGEVASRLADSTIVTSDNPRDEPPQDIIAAIVAGMSGVHEIEPDRARAISRAIHEASAGDIVLLAGKGHEDYQEVAGVKYPFSDEAEARKCMKGWLQ
ncbi:UDP-N-acetylmuramoyl-L-alanyl-D-glutamate--2, 6-diaminopimelate ligase [Methylophilaceae bacterium]|nr:UDP-N-acetylmuramoyl-L-alanyl-D-glutamate--2, 6-diaminopimelate ligase [Methylophilaceae bacterium]